MIKETFWHNLSIRETGIILKTDLKKGLSEEEAKDRQKKVGKNLLPTEKPLSGVKIFLEQFRSPLIYILVIAGVITLFLKEYTDSIVIFGAVILNTIVGFFQENKANQALRELKKTIMPEAKVLRGGNEKVINSSDLVLGDVFILDPGDKIPADGRLIEAYNLKVNEATLTGEWISAEKKIDIFPKKTPLADRDNMVYMGTIIEEGKGRVVVSGIGIQTEVGKIAQMVKETKEEKTPYQKRLLHFTKIIGLIVIIMSIFIFLEGILTGGKFIEMFTVAVAVAVAAIPEGLPIAITVVLSLGMQRILKRRGLVRKLLAAETLGSTSVICTDKTGTLTEGNMQVAGIYTGTKELLSDGQKYSERVDRDGVESHILALKIATLCGEAFIENPDKPLEEWIIRGRPTDKALLVAGIQAGLDKKELEKEQPKIIDLPFSSSLRHSASLHRFSERENILYILGAPEKILEKSRYIEIDGKQKLLSEEKIRELNKKYETLAVQGQRILATAYRKIAVSKEKAPSLESFEEFSQDLIFVGFIALRDPLRKEAKRAIKICRQAGIRIILVTGDHRLTAKAVATEIGFKISEKNIFEGEDLDKLSDEEFAKRLKEIQIYARVEPKHKIRIIKAWQDKGEVVAMTGDGINDAPALKKADIGIALGSGTDVAKETSDLILLSDSFDIIVAAIEEGRAIIDNIRKVITYVLSDSFTEVILIGTAIMISRITGNSFILPVTAVQILWVNLIEDGLPSVALAFEPKDKDLMERKPYGHRIPLMTKEMKVLIFIIGIITDIILLGLFFWLIKYSGYRITHIQSMIFVGLTIGSLFYVFSCKSLRKNIWSINIFSNKFLIFSWFIGVIALLAALYLEPLQKLLGTEPLLNPFDWVLLLSLGLLNLLLIEGAKYYFIRKKKFD
ncbi:MAG TPA: HAD family hydrolase [Candidatus Nealsonbacteria bacterium]|uniref:Cation-transporting P-type ATPase N-terminal domain-containing protein n=1 Tax=marine sediment metagenome TaxID=412755 RepID=A0A0F9WNE1_9ZZZZ|nr:HAD family hydrolase [Candidatus Nealsonbacteria bacterium]HEB46834.1 HAD family hydrolase [Candidatus Nealsonbacteria bacterium]